MSNAYIRTRMKYSSNARIQASVHTNTRTQTLNYREGETVPLHWFRTMFELTLAKESHMRSYKKRAHIHSITFNLFFLSFELICVGETLFSSVSYTSFTLILFAVRVYTLNCNVMFLFCFSSPFRHIDAVLCVICSCYTRSLISTVSNIARKERTYSCLVILTLKHSNVKANPSNSKWEE